jgi:multidrug efflux pump subunit AcrA (membrane-fusion protein)
MNISIRQTFLLFFSASILLTGCNNAKPGSMSETKASTPVTVTHVSFEPITEYVELNATSVFQKKSIIRATTTGIVSLVDINPGDKVSQGQALFAITTKEAVALMGKNVKGDSSFHFKGELKIKAIQSGIVNTIAHQQGDYVQEGDELATLAEQSSLVFHLQAPFELTGYIHTGQSCEIALPNNETINGVIGSILPSMNEQAQTLALVVKPLTSKNLPDNLIAKVKIVKYTKKNACTLPKEAVLTDETQTSFWVMKLLNDSTAVKIGIRKGIETNGAVELLQPAFTSSDRILVTGNYGLEDTAKVNITKK